MHISAVTYASQALTVRTESVRRPVDLDLDTKTEVCVWEDELMLEDEGEGLQKFNTEMNKR